jgi:hypothetical protein
LTGASESQDMKLTRPATVVALIVLASLALCLGCHLHLHLDAPSLHSSELPDGSDVGSNGAPIPDVTVDIF